MDAAFEYAKQALECHALMDQTADLLGVDRGAFAVAFGQWWRDDNDLVSIRESLEFCHELAGKGQPMPWMVGKAKRDA